MKTATRALMILAAAVSFGSLVPPEVAAQPRARPEVPDHRVKYPPIGRQVRVLPDAHQSIRIGTSSYFYHLGVFYRPAPQGYIVIGAPLHARVRQLPPGYISFVLGTRRYFYVNFTYYLWDEPRREYVVVEEPQGAAAAVVAANESGSGEIFVYPNLGQSDEQRDRDRYECYLWAVQQTGFDPSADAPQVELAGNYRRALSACLEGRGYTVK
jgi:hypothetical protein